MHLGRQIAFGALAVALLGSPIAWSEEAVSPSEDAGALVQEVEAADTESGAEAPMEADASTDATVVLTVQDALTIATQQNPSLEVIRHRIEQARQRVVQARSAYFPTVDARYTMAQTWLSDNQLRAQRSAVEAQQRAALSQRLGGGQGGGTLDIPSLAAGLTIWGSQAVRALDIDETREQYSGSVQANWIVFDGFERKFTLTAAKLARVEFEIGYDEFLRQLQAAVADTYYRAQLARQLVTIARADEAFQDRQLREAEARRRVGTGSLSDMLNFEVRKNQALANVIDAERAYDIALIGLATLLGYPESQFPEPVALVAIDDEQPEEMGQPDEVDLVSAALANRPDLRQQTVAVDRTGASARAARAPVLPQVIASASVDATRDNDAWPDANDYTRTLGLTVTYNLFAGGRNRAAYLEAREREKEARWELTALENEAAQEVRAASESVRTAQQLLILERRNAELVQRTRDLVEREYSAGQASLVRLNEAQRDLILAEANLVSALIDLRRAWYELRSATGETLR